ncbi:MAG: hypothetical protein AAB425_07050, partial [Bdellovibrionota bacterium]
MGEFMKNVCKLNLVVIAGIFSSSAALAGFGEWLGDRAKGAAEIGGQAAQDAGRTADNIVSGAAGEMKKWADAAGGAFCGGEFERFFVSQAMSFAGNRMSDVSNYVTRYNTMIPNALAPECMNPFYEAKQALEGDIKGCMSNPFTGSPAGDFIYGDCNRKKAIVGTCLAALASSTVPFNIPAVMAVGACAAAFNGLAANQFTYCVG